MMTICIVRQVLFLSCPPLITRLPCITNYLVLALQNLRSIDVHLVVVSVFMAIAFFLIVQGRLALLAGLELADGVKVLSEAVDFLLMI